MINGWEKETINDVASVGDGAHASIKRVDKGVLYLTSKNFDLNGLKLSKVDYISKEDYLKYFKEDSKALTKPRKGDILLSIIGSMGAAHLVNNDDDFGLSSSVSILRPNTNIIPAFLLYWTKGQYFQESIKGIKSGVAQSFLSLAMIRSLPCIIPPLPTQQKIANILSAYDDLIENNIKRIKLLEEQAQLIYEEWFVRMKFPNHENTKIDAEIGLPESWEIVTVNSLLAKAKSTKKIKKSEILDEGIIPVVDQSRDFIAGFTNEVDALVETEEPIIVFGDHTRVLKLVNFDFARGADGTQLIVSNSERMPQHLFYHVLQALDLSNYHYARHFKYLKSEEVVLPDVDTANSFEGFASLHYQLIQKLRLQNQKLKEARDILLPRLMMGIIEV